jgi:hypothetical protein
MKREKMEATSEGTPHLGKFTAAVSWPPEG